MGDSVTLLAPTALGLLAGSGYLDLTGTSANGRSVTAVAAALLRYETGLGVGPRGSQVLHDAGLFASTGPREHDQLLDSQVEPFMGWRDPGRRGGDLAVDTPRVAVGTWVARHREEQGITCSAICETVARSTLTDATLLHPQLEDLESGRSWTPRAPSFIAALGLEAEVVVSFGDAVGGVARALLEGVGTGEVPAEGAHAPACTSYMESWLQTLTEPPGRQTEQERSVAYLHEGAPHRSMATRQESTVDPSGPEWTSGDIPNLGPEEHAQSAGRDGSGARRDTWLSDLRDAAGLSRAQVAAALHLGPPAHVWLWETGRQPLPARYLGPIAELYRVDQAAIEAAVEISEEAEPDGKDASSPPGDTPLGELRAAAGLLPSDIAEALGLSTSTRVSLWETGREPLPARYLAPIAELYGVDQAAIEAVVELSEEAESDGKDASAPRGESPLGGLRVAAGLSRAHVAGTLDLSAAAYLWLWETGRQRLPAKYLGPLAELYGVDQATIEAVVEISERPSSDGQGAAAERDNPTLGELRKEAGLSRSDVAETLRLSSASPVSEWEKDQQRLPAEYLAPLADLYGVNQATIEAVAPVGERPPPPPQSVPGPGHDTPLGELRAAAGLVEADVARTLRLRSPVRVALWETGREPLPLRYLAPLADLYGVDQAAIEAVIEVGQRPPPPPQDVSGHRGHAARAQQRADAGPSPARVAEALGLSSPPRASQWQTGRDALPPRELAPSTGMRSVRQGAHDDAAREGPTAFDQLASFEALQGVHTTAVELSTRLRNVLRRLRIARFGDLQGMTIDDFRQIKNVGSKTADELVGLLDGSRSVTRVGAEARPNDGGPGPGTGAADGPGYIPAPWETGEPEALREDGLAAPRALMRDLGEVAAWWAANRGQAKLPELFRAEPDGSMPPSVMAAFDRLTEANLRELAQPDQLAAHDPVARFESAVLELDGRVRDVLVRRAGHDPETLESIGASHQVTRERIRQLEAHGRRTVDALLATYPEVAELMPDLRARLLPVVSEELLDEVTSAAFPGLRTCDAGAADLFRSSIVRGAVDLRGWRDGWLAPPDLLAVLRDASRGRYDGHSLQLLRTRLGHTDRSAVPVTTLLDLLGLTEVDGIVRSRPAGLPARAFFELETAGEPLAFDVLLDRLGPDVNNRSLRNALMSDELIVRTDRDVFALAEWGLETYEPIADMIARHLSARGGSSTMDAVIEDLTSRFSVAASSVRAYVRSDRFVELPDGTFRERTDADPADEQLRPVRAYAGCVRISGRWAYRVLVDEQLLSGYSAPVPTSFAAHLGLRPQESRMLASELGTDVSVTRKGLNPMLGRLRPVAQQLELGPGSLLFVIEPGGPGRPLSFIGYDVDRLGEASPRERAGLQLGLEPPFDIGDVLRALDLDGEPPEAAVALLRARGEDEFADALGTDRSEVEEGPSTDAVARLLGL